MSDTQHTDPAPDPEDVAELVDMTDDEFTDTVLAHLHRPTAPEGLWEALLHPGLVHRTRDVLRTTLASINQQFGTDAGRNADPLWRKKAATFEGLLKRRATDVRLAARAAHEYHQERARNHSHRIVRQLADAINQHRLACIAAGLEPEPHDVALWSVLDEVRVRPVGGPRSEEVAPTISEAIVNGYWTSADAGRAVA